MNDSFLLRFDFEDFPNSKDFYKTIRKFLTDKKTILTFYYLLNKVERNPKINIQTIMEYVRFGISYNSNGVNIRLSFDDY